jgi:hypothetical protein
MRGDPGDAMARMKRWEAVRQRLDDDTGQPVRLVDEVVDAVGDVVRHHDTATVTVTVDDGGNLSTVRIVQRGGQLEVTHLRPQAPPSAPAPPSPPVMPAPPAEPRRNGDAVPRAIRPEWRSRDAETLDQTAARLAELIRQNPSLLDGND